MSEMACNELVETITAYLDGTLPEADRLRFDAHLDTCPPCAVYLTQMRETIARLGALDDAELSQAARDELVAVFRDWRSWFSASIAHPPAELHSGGS